MEINRMSTQQWQSITFCVWGNNESLGVRRSCSRREFHVTNSCHVFVFDRCPTKNRMVDWGIDTDPTCILCNSYLESRDHLFYACSYSWEVWHSIAGRVGFSTPRNWNVLLGDLERLKSPQHIRLLTLLAWQTTYLLHLGRTKRSTPQKQIQTPIR